MRAAQLLLEKTQKSKQRKTGDETNIEMLQLTGWPRVIHTVRGRSGDSLTDRADTGDRPVTPPRPID